MALIVVRLRPAEPVPGADFEPYLDGLTINALDLSTTDGDGVLIGQASYLEPPDSDSRIAQHLQVEVIGSPPTPTEVPAAVATAVIEVEEPAGHPEHGTSDLRLSISRNGGTIVHDQVYFNVPVTSDGLPADPADFPDLEPSGLYVTLPEPGRELSTSDAFVTLPTDGTPPAFDDLLAAVEIVLAGDPGGGADPAALTPTQASHVGYEITWNQKLRPLPQPPADITLEQLYTLPDADDEETVAARQQFEGELAAYYATGDAEAERLAGFVFALAAAVGEQRTSEDARWVGFLLPVLPGVTETGAQLKSVRVLLTDPTSPLEPSFAVPASYFYALGATMATTVSTSDRYRLATLEEEEWLRTALRAAIDAGIIDEDPAVTVDQAARRLRALGAVGGVAPGFELNSDPAVQALAQAWLDFIGADVADFWAGPLSTQEAAGHLRLVLQALADSHQPLIAAIQAIPVSTVEDLRNRTAEQWRQLFGDPVDVALLPAFTAPGSPAERVEAFTRHAQKFFEVDLAAVNPAAPVLDAPPTFRPLSTDPITRFAASYQARAGVPIEFGGTWDAGHLAGAVADVFPDAPAERGWLEQAVRTIDELALLAAGSPAELRFSVMEALYARGFTSREQVRAFPATEFRTALIGTVAYEHADAVYAQAGTPAPSPGGGGRRGFQPVNPDGCLVDCVPPPHRSPFGPVAYLHDLLALTSTSTCEQPAPADGSPTLAELLADRRGPLADLLVTRSNLEVPLPAIDLANECLEAVAATLPATPAGAVRDTAADELAGHRLADLADPDRPGHDPATLFAAVPEHSTPATPVAAADSYAGLRADFSTPALPYPQALDINRTYLGHLRSSRYETMRRFRRDITELALDPAAEPAEFQRHLWRYPVRIDVACEYLGISAEEHALLYATDIAVSPGPGRLVLWELYGFPAERVDDRPWTHIVVQLSEFLDRTGLSYCEFLALSKAGVVEFSSVLDLEYPDCEPCHLDDYVVLLVDPVDALRRLAVFLRLWRTLRALPGGGYSFTELRDICAVLRLFHPDGTINPDFIRQLAAFQILRDDFGLALTDGTPAEPGATGADRTHLLALWVGLAAGHWDWAVDELLDQLQPYAAARHGCGCRPPEFRKLLVDNLDPLSRLAGFNPAAATDTWHAAPTHTLRFAEVLAKIYASDFHIGEIRFLVTSDEHLDGDDPFPLQPPNEALARPLDLPDDEGRFALTDLRRALLAVEVSDADAAAWSWQGIDQTLRAEFDYRPAPAGRDPLVELGEHFFPSVLSAAGHTVGPNRRQYRVPLPGSPPLLWNTPPDGPFQYDAGAGELWTEVPIGDDAVIAKLSRVRQLTGPEQAVVRELYFAPRAALAEFAFLFADLDEAQQRLIQDPDEDRRWAYFQRSFATCYARCRLIAEHLAGQVVEWTGQDHGERADLAWRLLSHLYADENRATGRWEDDSGQPPAVSWPDRPAGGAFPALLGLVGTGLLGEFTPDGGPVGWREVRGPVDAFGVAENAANAPVPTVLPAMNLTLTPAQQQFVSVRNGFAIANPDGALVGGAQPFTVRWSGILLIDGEGEYTFRAGAPTPEGVEPDLDAADDKRWRVALRRGQRSWVLLSHDWPDENAPAGCSAPLVLRRGAYQLTVELAEPQPVYRAPEDVCPVTGGFQVKYAGPDSDGTLVAVPRHRLFLDAKRDPLGHRIDGMGTMPQQFLRLRYVSTLRDIRRTYQRAVKALLFAHRFALSAQPVADDGQSEIGYLLGHPDDFAGTSYYRDGGGGIAVHRAFFDPNLLPVRDNYLAPTRAQDQRAAPSPRREQALFDWWERIFDYTIARRDARTAPERPLWLLFHEAAENHPDDPAHLLRHLGVDLLHAPLVLRYHDGYRVSSGDLEDERWTVRAWRADRWLDGLRAGFLVDDIRTARPDLWASDDPGEVVASETESGNANLTRFVRDGCIENREPRRYQDITRLNDGLRERGRAALLANLCGMDRVSLPWGGFASEPLHLSELLLLDVEAGGCQRASRLEQAVSAVQEFVQRARLDLEPDFAVTAEFAALWDRRFATFRTWEACRRREVYRENWIDWDELEQARRSEAFRFLEAELRRATLTAPVAGGLEYWLRSQPAVHSGLAALQASEPALIGPVDPEHHGFDLLGTPQRHAQPSWLAPIGPPSAADDHDDGDGPGGDGPAGPGGPGGDGPSGRGRPGVPGVVDGPRVPGVPGVPGDPATPATRNRLPLWVKAAVRLGVRFLRVAAAAEPLAATEFAPHRPAGEPPCCPDCGAPHPVTVDEYYFWLLDATCYQAVAQDAGWSWHDSGVTPSLLHWDAGPAVRLAWCRVHNDVVGAPRYSAESVRVGPGEVELTLRGRTADSLAFEVSTGIPPDGHDPTTLPGFRYDLVTDAALALPLVVPAAAPGLAFPGGLPAYPYFAYVQPGAPVGPASPHAPVLAVAGSLRAHCQFEAALKWYELLYAPLRSDSTWLRCGPDEGRRCCQDSTIRTAADARQRSVVLHYLETLLDWADALLRRNTPEAFDQARLVFQTAAKLLGPAPRVVRGEEDTDPPEPVAAFAAHRPRLNPRLVQLYELTQDRQELIRGCLNARRLGSGTLNKDMPYWRDDSLRDGWRRTAKACLDDVDWCAPQSPYRYLFLVGQAQQLAAEVRSLGAALLAAYEKGDAEYLAAVRGNHERQLLTLALENRQNLWREADWQLQALQKTKEAAQTRHRYYTLLIQNGLNNREHEVQALTNAALGLRAASNVSEGVGQVMNAVPDMFVGFPLSFTQLPVGTKLGGVFGAMARISNSLADIASTTAGLRLTQAGWERREEEWRHQVEVLDIELEQMERQILAAERRRDVALRELDNHQLQIDQAGAVQDFLQDKFTSHDLYLWLQQETAALHEQMYELALRGARQAQRAFNYERGHTSTTFVTGEVWDQLRDGLLAGERLQLALRQMEHTYLDANAREYELVKHLSLRLHFPVEFLRLQATGTCEITVPEWMFDLDHPGHYLRRIKNVTLTIPCVVGPYAGVHARLTLLSSTTRVQPYLLDPPHACCADGAPGNGYPALPDDPRIVSQYAATEAIATSSGQNDAGMFELNFRDDRYLPFEFAGAVSRWRVELPRENNQFDVDTVADVVLHMSYTAREGGEVLRRAANEIAQRNLPGAGVRYFDVRHDMPDAWRQFQVTPSRRQDTELPLRLGATMFGYLPSEANLRVRGLDLFFEAPDADPSRHQLVQFVPVGADVHSGPDDCDAAELRCVASADWPGLYHGVLDGIDLGPLRRGVESELGRFRFPAGVGPVSRVFFFCRYQESARADDHHLTT